MLKLCGGCRTSRMLCLFGCCALEALKNVVAATAASEPRLVAHRTRRRRALVSKIKTKKLVSAQHFVRTRILDTGYWPKRLLWEHSAMTGSYQK